MIVSPPAKTVTPRSYRRTGIPAGLVAVTVRVKGGRYVTVNRPRDFYFRADGTVTVASHNRAETVRNVTEVLSGVDTNGNTVIPYV